MVKFFLKNLRLIVFRKYREKKIAKIISQEIIKLSNNKSSFKILDYGSGMQPEVILLIINLLNKANKKKYKVDCFDYYSNENIRILNNINKNINFFNLSDFPLTNEYDFALIIDVLHHIKMDNYFEHIKILKNISQYCNYIFIKDHFQFGFFSNRLLRLMDFIGNYYNGVYLPKKYFTISDYNKIISDNKFEEIKRITNIYYYRRLWLFFSNPKLHFISILKLKFDD